MAKQKQSKQRYIDTHFWRDTFISSLDPSEKLLFSYLLTNPETNLSGIYEINLKIMACDTGIDLEMCKKILSRFQEAKKVYYIDGWIVLCNFPKHQNFEERPKIKIAIDNQLLLIPETIRNMIASKSIPYVYDMHILPIYSDSDSDLNKIQDDEPDEPEVSFPQKLEKPVINDNKPVKSSRFVKPEIIDISAYISERRITGFTAEQFYDYYESIGWMIKKSPMKDWKATVRTWERRQNQSSPTTVRPEENKPVITDPKKLPRIPRYYMPEINQQTPVVEKNNGSNDECKKCRFMPFARDGDNTCSKCVQRARSLNSRHCVNCGVKGEHDNYAECLLCAKKWMTENNW